MPIIGPDASRPSGRLTALRFPEAIVVASARRLTAPDAETATTEFRRSPLTPARPTSTVPDGSEPVFEATYARAAG